MLYNILFTFFFSTNLFAAPKCIECHLPNNQSEINFATIDQTKDVLPHNCQSCHVNIHAAVNDNRPVTWPTHLEKGGEKLFTESYLYVTNPQLMYQVDKTIRFTECGFKSFLKNPVARKYNNKLSMFPLSEKEITEAIKENKIPLEKCVPQPLDEKQQALGEKLFSTHCLQCHNANANSQGAIRIRLGYPLFTEDYFQLRLKNKDMKIGPHFLYHYYWKTKGNKISKEAKKNEMPTFSNLSKTEIKALYQYVSRSKEDINNIVILDEETVMANNPLESYQIIEQKIFNGSCRHCHFASNQIINSVFDVEKPIPAFFNEKRPLLKSEELNRLFSTGKSCEPSMMEQVLRERHFEVKGNKQNPNIKGMPLNLAPLPFSVIKQFKEWSIIGCPSPNGFLCTKRDQCKS